MIDNTAARTWFITGASSGLGRAFSEHAAQRGHNVVATARNTDALADLAAAYAGRVLTVTLDVRRPADADAAVAAALARFGRIDLLVNNAGYGVVGAFEETSDAELRALMDTNFFGAMNVTRAVLPAMRAQRSGAVAMISSLGGQLSFAGFSAYSATKFAMEGISEALAQEVAPFGVKVLIVEPGQFRTNLAGAGMRHMPVIDAYRDIVAGTREFAHHAWNAGGRSDEGGRRDRSGAGCAEHTAAASARRGLGGCGARSRGSPAGRSRRLGVRRPRHGDRGGGLRPCEEACSRKRRAPSPPPVGKAHAYRLSFEGR